jgi:translation initiation factor 3 subunit J
MANKWDDEDSDSSSDASSPPAKAAAVSSRRKFDDEEDDSDVLESWDAAEDSEVEREKEKKEAERKAKAEAEAAANKKSKAQRIAEKKAEHARRLAQDSDESSEEEETEAQRRERLRQTEQDADLKHAEDLFGNIGISNSRKVTTAANAVQVDAKNPGATVDLTALPLFDPKTKLQFEKLRDTLVPVIGANSKKAQYTIFLQEFTKQLAKDLPSDQIKTIASTLTALSNEKLKEEKSAEKGGKKSKAQKTKVALVASKNISSAADTRAYDEDYDDDDFM